MSLPTDENEMMRGPSDSAQVPDPTERLHKIRASLKRADERDRLLIVEAAQREIDQYRLSLGLEFSAGTARPKTAPGPRSESRTEPGTQLEFGLLKDR